MYVIATVDKSFTKEQIRAEARKNGQMVEFILDAGEHWDVRLADLPPFMKKDEEGEDSGGDDAPKEESGDDKEEAPKSEKKDDGEEKSDSKGESKSDSLGELKSLISDLQSQVEKVLSVAEQVSSDAESKQQKMEEIHDSVKDHVKGEKGGEGEAPAAPVPPSDAPPAAGLEDIPGPPPGGPGAGPKPPAAGPKVPGAPGGRGMPGGKPQRPVRPPSGVPVFTKNQSEVITHPGVDAEGNKITLVAAAAAIEADEEWADYEVAGMTENHDGTFSAKLKLKSE
jgi:hypothetical protein